MDITCLANNIKKWFYLPWTAHIGRLWLKTNNSIPCLKACSFLYALSQFYMLYLIIFFSFPNSSYIPPPLPPPYLMLFIFLSRKNKNFNKQIKNKCKYQQQSPSPCPPQKKPTKTKNKTNKKHRVHILLDSYSHTRGLTCR